MARHPIIRNDSLRSLRIPDLMGGINLRDSVNMINDNQMTESLNMWWADGTLKTRPAVEGEVITEIKQPSSEHSLISKTDEIRRHNCTKEQNGRKGQLCSVKTVFDFSHTAEVKIPEIDDEGNETENTKEVTTKVSEFKTVINFFWCFGDYNEALPPLEVTDTIGVKSYFAVWHNDTLYCFLSNHQIHKYISGTKWDDVKEEDRETSDGEIESSRIYVPLVATNCFTNGEIPMTAEEVLNSGILYEGYNLLSDYYKIQYNAFSYMASLTQDNGNKMQHEMTYFLLEPINDKKYEGKVITAEYIKNGTTYRHSVKLDDIENKTEFVESTAGGDGFKLKVHKNCVYFMKGTEKAYINEDEYHSTIEITAPYIPNNREEELDRIFLMKESCWYGGSAEGIEGGTRLFLCGNENEKSLVIWSGRNNPLYFSENSYFYVGDKSGAVTGFGKQSNLLVIFKNYETWCTQYTRNSGIEADDLVNQTVVDYSSSSVYFPLSQINASIGCAYPDTIALCRNRLVWLSHNGQVYTLVSESQYNERNIFCISEMVSRKLKTENAVPTACDWNGHYVLCFGGRLYLMDYNSYGYQYVASYSKTEDANLRIPWYYWEMPEICEKSVLTNSSDIFDFVFVKDDKISKFHNKQDASEDIVDGKERKISNYFITKLFDFDAPSRKKNIQLVNLLIGNNGGDTVKVELVTEHGNEQQEIELDDSETALRSAGYITNKAIIPCIKAVRLFGVKVSSEGLLAVDGMQFNFRLLGGIR